MPENLPLDEGWGEVWDDMAPVGREFGSKDYERLATLDALADAAKAAANAMKANRSSTTDPLKALNGSVLRFDDPTDPIE